jgi:hypothetical protein
VLGSLEARTGKDAWRNPAPLRQPGEDRIYYGHQVTSGDRLRFLVNGYTLRCGGSSQRHQNRRRGLRRIIRPSPGRDEQPVGAGLRFCPHPTGAGLNTPPARRRCLCKRKRLRPTSLVGHSGGVIPVPFAVPAFD